LAALAAHGVTVHAMVWDPKAIALGHPDDRTDVRKVDVAHTDGLAHDPAKLAVALRDLLV